MARLLVIEPNIVLAQIYQTILTKNKHKVWLANNAQEAINLADKTHPEVVILELQLPLHNGLEFLYEFRSYSEWRDIPVIIQSLVSPNEFKDSFILWHKLGIRAYLYKPKSTLLQLIDSVNSNLPQPVRNIL
jgi:putative two-component system response regulator